MTEKDQQLTFENWLQLHKALIFKIVRAYAFTPMDRDDLFQEVVIQVWRSIPSFRQESAVTTWIYRVALNTAITWVKKERKHQTENLDGAQHVLQEGVPTDERLAWLYEEINKLDEIDRSIALMLLDDVSYQEMADILGITKSNVGIKIHRIKQQLMAKSNHYGV